MSPPPEAGRAARCGAARPATSDYLRRGHYLAIRRMALSLSDSALLSARKP
jgi:hypothetical protein